jgi:hypothetical protein
MMGLKKHRRFLAISVLCMYVALLLSPFLYVGNVAASPTLNPPELNPPDLNENSPDLKSPDLQSPDLQSPDLQGTELNGDHPTFNSPTIDSALGTLNDMSGEEMINKASDWTNLISATITAVQGAQFAGDALDGYKYYKLLKTHFKSFADMKEAWNAMMKSERYGKLSNAKDFKGRLQLLSKYAGKGQEFWSKITKTADLAEAYESGVFGRKAKWLAKSGALKVLGKASPIFAVYETASSTVDAVANFANGEVNAGIANTGEALMAGSALLAASGVGAPVAAGVAVAGGALWVGAKIYEHRAFIGKAASAISPVGQAVGAVKSAVSDGVKNVAGKAIDTVKGWFG